jgi:hypothetical protein
MPVSSSLPQAIKTCLNYLSETNGELHFFLHNYVSATGGRPVRLQHQPAQSHSMHLTPLFPVAAAAAACLSQSSTAARLLPTHHASILVNRAQRSSFQRTVLFHCRWQSTRCRWRQRQMQTPGWWPLPAAPCQRCRTRAAAVCPQQRPQQQHCRARGRLAPGRGGGCVDTHTTLHCA